MNQIIENIKQQIAEFQMDGGKVIVAVSGGRDSMLMLRLLEHTSLQLMVAHVNFGLRENESAEDAEFVIQYCKNHNIPIETLDLTGEYDHRLGGIQEWAREMRYAFFEELKAKHHASAIAVAHHQSDQAETILYQFLRGGGLAAMRGMRPWYQGVWRPLLGIANEEVDRLVKELKIQHREDSSNRESKYARNKIRHDAAPILNQIVPNWSTRLAQRAGLLSELEEYLQHKLLKESSWFERVNEHEIFIDDAKWKTQSIPRYRLWNLLDTLGFSGASSEEVEKLMSLPVGRIFENRKWKVARERSGLRLFERGLATEISAVVWTEINDLPPFWADWKIEKRRFSEVKNNLTKDSIALRVESLKFPLTVRSWQEGDRIQTFGMKGRKLVSRLLIQQKSEQKEKQTVMVWSSGETIYWVVGHAVSELCRATTDEEVLFLEKRDRHETLYREEALKV